MKTKNIIVPVLVSMLLLISIAVFAEQKPVLIAVASDGKTADSNVSGLAGRAPYYLLFDAAGNFVEVLDNPYKNARGGAGPSVINFLVQKDVTFTVAGTFGQNMISMMDRNGIKRLAFKGAVSDAVAKARTLK